MVLKRVPGRAKRPRIDDDSDEDVIQNRNASPFKRARESSQNGRTERQFLTPTTSEEEQDNEGNALRGPWIPLSHINSSPMTCPKSSYAGWSSSVGKSSEIDALQSLLDLWHADMSSRSHIDGDHIEFEISDFTIYQQNSFRYLGRNNPPTTEEEMCSLDLLSSKRGLKTLFLDAVISYGSVKHFLQRVPFDTVSIDGYDNLDLHGITNVYLQTRRCKQRNIWLRLGQPSSQYARYHEPFLWAANFGKHVVDYMFREPGVTLDHFRSHFFSWAEAHHGTSRRFRTWAASLHSTDFRIAFNRYFQWLRNEATNESMDTKGTIREHPIWREADSDSKFLTAIPQQPSHASIEKTIVTPYVYKCFNHMYFGQQMEPKDITDTHLRTAHEHRKKELGFPRNNEHSKSTLEPIQLSREHEQILVGDVVGVRRDVETKWLSKSTVWYFYVNRVQTDDEGLYYKGIWLYESQDTTMANMKYPHKNELFMSDNCNCDESMIRSDHVVTRALAISWTPGKIPSSTHFIRQTFVTSDQSFRTLQDDDFVCNCQKPKIDEFAQVQQDYAVYDTVLVLVKRRGQEILEPCIIEEFIPSKQSVRVRQLPRAGRDFDCAESKANELVWTSKFYDVKATCVVRKCNVRFLVKHAQCDRPKCRDCKPSVPFLYDRNGQADCFLITKRLMIADGKDVAVDLPYVPSTPMVLGQDFARENTRRMNAMSLFCGGGNFDRGLADSGAIESRWAVEWNAHAAHTYRANQRDPDSTSMFLGSVDEHLRRALAGQLSTTVPAIGKVDVILAGSPCQGFSSMQPNKLSVGSLNNASKVATVASYIDLWRPTYAVLENVPEMTRQVGHNKQENVFSQLLCCLVGMGYQVQQFLMDAWSYGEAQSRPRLFIIATAPGLPLLKHPNMTHSHPDDMHGKSLGKAPNGQPFGLRYHEPTIFPFVSAREVTKDLPRIGDGHPQACISMPDHRPGLVTKPMEQQLIRTIPKRPRGQGLVDILADSEDLPKILHDWIFRQSEMRLSENSKSYRRLEPRKLFRTVTTQLSPSDGKAGYGIHWEQDRVLTVMEARRAQGFPDHEVILGDASAQWKIIGNSVSRAVALALGISLREVGLSRIRNSSHITVNGPPRLNSPIVVIAHPQERRSKKSSAPFTRSSPGLRLEIEGEPHISIRTTIQDEDSRPHKPIQIKSCEHHGTASSPPNTFQAVTLETTRALAPFVQNNRQSHSDLTIRPSQSSARQLPKLKTTTIIKLEDSGKITDSDSNTSAIASRETPPFTIYQDTISIGSSVRSTAGDLGMSSQSPTCEVKHVKGEMVNAKPVGRVCQSTEQPLYEIDDEDDDVVFISSRIVRT